MPPASSPTKPNRSDGSEDKIPMESYIMFLGLEPGLPILFTTESIKYCLGYTPEEVVNTSGFTLTHPHELESLQKLSVHLLKESVVAGLVECQAFHKTDGWVDMSCMTNVCYDCMVVVAGRRGFDLARDSAWKNSADTAVRCRDGKLEQARWTTKNNQMLGMLQDQFDWEKNLPKSEPRTCLVLNRFTKFASVLYATKSCKEVLGTDASDVVGKALYDFVADSAELCKQIDILRSNHTVSHVTFTWTGKGDTKENSVECEAVITSAWDGLMCIIRRRDAVQKQKSQEK